MLVVSCHRPPKFALVVGQNAKKYHKKIVRAPILFCACFSLLVGSLPSQTVHAYRSKDPVTVLKDWVRARLLHAHACDLGRLKLIHRCSQGKNVGQAGCIVIAGTSGDVYTMDAVR